MLNIDGVKRQEFTVQNSLNEQKFDAGGFIHELEYSETSQYKNETLKGLSGAFYNNFENDSQKKALADDLISSPILTFHVDNNILIQINFVTRKVHKLSEIDLSSEEETILNETVINNIATIQKTMSTILENAQTIRIQEKQTVVEKDITEKLNAFIKKDRAEIATFLNQIGDHIGDNYTIYGIEIENKSSIGTVGLINKFMRINLNGFIVGQHLSSLRGVIKENGKVETFINKQTNFRKKPKPEGEGEGCFSERNEEDYYKFGEALIKSLLSYQTTKKMLDNFLDVK